MPNPIIQSQQLPYPDQIQSGRVESSSLPLASINNKELFRARASLLAGIFRDELLVQEKTLSVIHNDLFSRYIETLPIKDIGRVIEIDTPVLTGLRILGKNPNHDLRIKGLRKQDAIKGKELIEGLLLEDGDSVDHQEVPIKKRQEMLMDSGKNPEYQDNMHPLQ